MRINNKKDVEAIYDTGANATYINNSIIEQIKADLFKHKSVFKTISGTDFSSSRAKLHMKLNKIEEVLDVFVVKNNTFSYDLLLGLDAIKKFKLSQDENLRIFQRVDNTNEREEIRTKTISREAFNIKKIKEENKEIMKKEEYIQLEDYIENLNHLNENEKFSIIRLIEAHKSTFAKEKFDIGTVKNHEATIKLKENSKNYWITTS